MKALNVVTLVLLVVGGLNWGLWGAFEFDLVAAIAGGSTAPLAKLVYVVVGLAAVMQGALLMRSVRPAPSLKPA